MATPRFAWGIDIGNRALKAIKLVRDGDSLRVDDFDVIEHETVLSNSGDNREGYITSALQQFVSRHPMKGGAASIGVSGQASFARFIKLPPVEEKKIPEIVRFEAIQQIPFPLDDVEWSYQLFRGDDTPDVEVGIFAMRKELINQHIKYFTDLDLNVQVVQMSPLAVYNAMSYDQRVEGTTMIIDLGAENTDLIIADADTIWLRSIPVGGNNFTEALTKAFKINFAKAEDLKRNAATSKYARQIFQAMRPVFADLVAEVQRSIGFYASVHRDSRIKRIVAVGGTFKLPGLQKYLQQNLQLEVERLDTLGAGAPPDPKQGAAFQDNILSMVSAYGLALQAMGEGKVTSSLLPSHIRRERLWQEKTKYFGAAAALFVIGTGIGFGSVFLGNMSLEGAADARGKLTTIAGQATDLDNRWTAVQGAGAADRQRIINVRSLAQWRDLYTHILTDINGAVPQLNLPPDQVKKIPRHERRQVIIERVVSRYLPDMGLVGDLSLPTYSTVPPASGTGGTSTIGGFGPAGFGAGAVGAVGATPPEFAGALPPTPEALPEGAVAAAPSPHAGLRGYVVTLFGRTPMQTAAAFLQETLAGNLRKLSRDKVGADRKYYIGEVRIVHLRPLREDAARVSEILTAYNAAAQAKTSGTFTAAAAAGGFGGGLGPEAVGPMPGGFGGGGYVPQPPPG
ncbi:MAG TPA: type IV pilus assembly protein PilM, partial [Tepidisphaeraceae bacterium]|nr:type IV pilus assembly protein PilM [Tepidisphaeraceae bacterium]